MCLSHDESRLSQVVHAPLTKSCVSETARQLTSAKQLLNRTLPRTKSLYWPRPDRPSPPPQHLSIKEPGRRLRTALPHIQRDFFILQINAANSRFQCGRLTVFLPPSRNSQRHVNQVSPCRIVRIVAHWLRRNFPDFVKFPRKKTTDPGCFSQHAVKE